jgi:hypothetical protein
MSLLMVWLMIQSYAQVSWLERLEEATQDANAAEQMLEDLLEISSPNALQLGYLGSVEMIMADHAFWPNQKWSYFRKGSEKLDKAIQLNPKNLEIRYLRLACQLNTPRMLGYDDYIEEDQEILMKGYKQLNNERLKKKIEQLLQKEGLVVKR